MNLNEEKAFPQLKDNIPKKISLCYYGTINQVFVLSFEEPINKLLSEYSDIETLLKISEGQITKFLYFHKNYVHKLLLDLDKNIHFEYKEGNDNLSFYFYLILLIKDMPYILYYTYDSKYIKELNDHQEKNNKIYNKLITSRILIELLDNYKFIYDCFEDENEEKINKMLKFNFSIIKDNIDFLKKLDIKWNQKEFTAKSIDLIYIEIIIALIKQKKFEDYDFTYDIINQLNFENIDINKAMFDKLYEILDSNEDYINDYIISNCEDIFNENKINFFFILIKYILKNPIYIYQIPFLMKVSKNVNKILKSKDSANSTTSDIYEKIVYIINVFTNTKGKYYRKILDANEINQNIEKLNNNYQYEMLNNILKQNYLERNLQVFDNENLTPLDKIYYAYKFFSNPDIRKSFVDVLNNPNLFNQIFSPQNFSGKELNIFKKLQNDEEFKRFLNKENFSEILIKEGVYYIDPFKEIKVLEENLPIKPNLKSVKIFSEFIEKEKKEEL